MSETLRADLARLHEALNTLDVPDRGDETDRFNHGQRWMLHKVRHALQRIHDSGVSPGASTWYRVDNGWRQDGWPGGSMFVQDGTLPGWGLEGPGSPLDDPATEYRHDDCATCGTKADPVILQHPAGYTLAEQVQAVWDEEGADGIADAIRRVARGEGA